MAAWPRKPAAVLMHMSYDAVDSWCPLPCSEQSKDDAARSVQQRLQQHEPSGGFYADIEQLESHWDKLDDPRKIMYAQMAVLTR